MTSMALKHLRVYLLKLLTFEDTYGAVDVLHEGLIPVLRLFHVSERLCLITSVTSDTLDNSLTKKKVKNYNGS